MRVPSDSGGSGQVLGPPPRGGTGGTRSNRVEKCLAISGKRIRPSRKTMLPWIGTGLRVVREKWIATSFASIAVPEGGPVF